MNQKNFYFSMIAKSDDLNSFGQMFVRMISFIKEKKLLGEFIEYLNKNDIED